MQLRRAAAPGAAMLMLALALAACNDGAEDRGLVSGTFVGALAGSDAFVAVVAADREAGASTREVTAYVTDGSGPAILLTGAPAANQAHLRGEAGARLEASVSTQAATGTVTLPGGQPARFKATRATGAAGLYHMSISAGGQAHGSSDTGARLDGRVAPAVERGRPTIAGTIAAPGRPSVGFEVASSGPLAGNLRMVVLPDGRIKGGNAGSSGPTDSWFTTSSRRAEAPDSTDGRSAGSGARLGTGLAGAVSGPLGTSGEAQGGTAPTSRATSQASFAAFSDVTTAAGITADHTAKKRHGDGVLRYLVTGQAWGDYDRDGWVDLYVTNQEGTNTLYRNDGDGTFSVSPLSASVALAERASGGGIFADYDNDGWLDLYVLDYGPDVLFHNEAGRGFTDVTAAAGIAEDGRGTTASWGDYDNDGHLDLYVANYGCQPCDSPGRDQGDHDRLFHNDGNGTFSDATPAVAGRATAGFGFVAGWVDYDNDRDLDLYLVNDVRGTRYLHPNALLRNDGPGCARWCFSDVSEATGAGVRVDGMGLAVADYDGDQDLDLYMSSTGWAPGSFSGPAVLLGNDGQGRFDAVSRQAGVDVDAVSWGSAFLDYDNDGWQDLYVALGFDPERVGHRARRDRLRHNRGDGTFHDATDLSPARHTDDTLGVASADYNNDGWPDVLVGNVDSGYRLYGNAATSGDGNHRLSVKLTGAERVNRDAVGARVYLATTDGRTQFQAVMAGSSLGAGNDLALNFGLGQASVRNLRVVWPDGHEQVFDQVPADVRWELTYGGQPSTSPLHEPKVPCRRSAPR